MRIALFGVNYHPETTGIAPFNTGLAEHWAATLHDVTVVTAFPHYPEWRVADGYRGKTFSRERRAGVRLLRAWQYVPPLRSTLRRIVYDSSLAASAMAWVPALGPVDLVWAVSPPLQLAAAAWAVSKARGAAFVLQVKDLVPDIAISLGMLRNPVAIAAARHLERFVYRRAQQIVVLSSGFAENLRAKGVPAEKISILPDWMDTDFIRPAPRAAEGKGGVAGAFRARHGISSEVFLAVHAGNMGAKQKLEVLLDAAAAAPEKYFLLVGDGVERARLEHAAAERRLANVKILPLLPRAELPALLAASDALVLNQAASVVDAVVPSKLLTYMAAGRPVVAATHPASESAALVRAADCGLAVAAEQASALVAALESLRRDPALARRLGDNGRQHVERHFARGQVLERFDAFVAAVDAARKRPAGAARFAAPGADAG
jgi:colanic acid biosynthesis glycosyl transferase WcaI